MPLLQRITTPINAVLQDINQVPRWRQAVGAIVASLVVHLLLILLFIAAAAFLPDVELAVPDSTTNPPPLEVQIVTTAQEEEVVTPEELKEAAQRPIIDSTGLAKTEEAPKDAIFESDENMKAGSQQPATGILPLPSQEGRDLPFPQFTNQRSQVGSPNLAPSVEMRGANMPAPIPPPKTTKAPEAKKPEPAEPKVEAQPPPKARETAELKPDEIAIGQKLKPRTSMPELAPQALPEAKPDRQEMAKLTTPSPQSRKRAGYQDEQIKTRVDGSISNRGPKGVDAAKTPLGRYKKQIKAQIGSRWYYYLDKRKDLYTTGTVRLSFRIDRNGKVSNVRLLENTANDSFAMMCQQCVFEAEIAPPPPEAETIMSDGELEDEVQFNYVPFQ
jgi:outer membrane biosynthesis protein TonB